MHERTTYGGPDDPLTPEELAQLRTWAVRQSPHGVASVYAVLRLLATVEAIAGEQEEAA